MIGNRISMDRLRADPAVAASSRLQQQLAIGARLRSASRGFTSLGAGASEDSISNRFRLTASRFASKIAVRTDTAALTYSELDALSNRVMWRVLASTGGSNLPVALLCSHDAFAVAGIVGILKAGAVYVALDPSFPSGRNQLVLEDCGTSLLLTDRPNLACASDFAIEGLHVALIGPSMRDERGAPPEVAPDQVATVVYTSGSTGRPKGVVHSHRNLLEVVRRYTNSLGIGSDDRQLLISSLSVTASVGNLFSALLSGATLFLFDLKDGGFHALSGWMRSERVSVYHSVASVFRHWCREIPDGLSFPDLRLVRLGGDLAYQSDFNLFRRSFPEAVLVNGYGCSEMSSVWHYYLDAGSDPREPVIPVGYPAEGVEAFLNPQEDGTGKDVGEIVLVSQHLALGYWGRAELTERAFASAGPGRLRTYRTGDLGWLSPDGCLVHAGRVDSQVKLNGFRVETADIEATLRSSPLVNDAAVVVESPSAQDRRLSAFVVFNSEEAGSVAQLENYLRDRLPLHMFPSSIVRVDRLPWTPNGKLDRAALSEWSVAGEVSQALATPPTFDEEAAIYRIWSKVLEADGFGIDDSLFYLGGTSIHAFRIQSEIHEAYGFRISFKTWMERPTVRELATQLRALLNDPRGSKAGSIPLHASDQTVRADASPSQVSLWMIQQMSPGMFAYNMTRTLLIRGNLRTDCLKNALAAVVARHGALRTVFKDDDGRIVQYIRREVPVIPVEVDLRVVTEGSRGVERDRLILIQAQSAFDMSQGPLFRVMLIRTGDEEHVFSATVHHIVCDAWSFDLFFRDLFRFYDRYLEGRSGEDIPPAPQYFQFCGSARENAPDLTRQKEYWTSQLQGSPSELPIVTDYALPARGSSAGVRYRFDWSERVTTKLRRIAREESATPFAAVLAVFAVLLSKYGACDEVVIGSATAGRTRPGSEEAIGLFARIVMLRVRVPGSSSFRQLLHETRRTLQEGLVNQDGASENLLNGQPGAPIAPARIVCVHRSSPVRFTTPRDLDVGTIELDRGAAKYDLTLIVSESGDRLLPAFEYKTDLFESSTVETLADVFLALAANLSNNPDQPLWATSCSPDSRASHSFSWA
jgi:amino acid adenylation domain-containing protein